MLVNNYDIFQHIDKTDGFRIVEQMKQKQEITEQLKAINPIKWTQLMNCNRQMKLFLQNLFLIDFESGIGAQLMSLFHLKKWKNSFVYGKIENTYTVKG